jgi:hypothetical protein
MWRGLVIWLLIMAIESALGPLRALFLAPLMGAEMAEHVGWPLGVILVAFITWLFARWIGLIRTSSLLTLGTVWAVLTVLFEIVIGFFRGFDWPRIVAEIDPAQGGLLIYSLIVMLLAPPIATRLRGA